MVAVDAVAIVALDGHGVLGDGEHLVGCHEADDIAEARISLRGVVAAAHTATDGDIEAGELPVLDDGDEAEILRVDVDVVGRRHREADLELARQVGRTIERLVVGSSRLLVVPDLGIGGGARAQVRTDLACDPGDRVVDARAMW